MGGGEMNSHCSREVLTVSAQLCNNLEVGSNQQNIFVQLAGFIQAHANACSPILPFLIPQTSDDLVTSGGCSLQLCSGSI